MLTKKDNMDLFLANREVEHIPISFWHHFVSFHDHYMALEKEGILDKVIEGQKSTIFKYKPDFVKVMSDGFFGHPSIWENDINEIEDLEKIISVGPNHEWIEAQIKYVNEILNNCPDDVYYFYNIFSPLQYIRLKFEEYDEDFSKFSAMFIENPQAMLKAAGNICNDIKELVRRLFEETKIDGVYYSVQNVQHELADSSFHKKYVEVSDLELLNEIRKYTNKVLLHICGYGNYKNDLKLYAHYPVEAVNWAVFTENISLGEGKKIFKKPVFGGFDNKMGSILYEGTKEELTRYIKKLLDDSGTIGVAIGADCTVSDTLSSQQVELINQIVSDYK
ncbi:hypothetical protein [Tuanshanicoccus lijuaniae]|uniref:hypothetical protein n=1 Tax=Aerococcaceae bacterium zg-1292 TaxID=2774330 RepID=UPI001BD83C10|nr:uroporphyrinogen decarboxylase [Aerococcaceae bacterium zg-BR22]MBS4455509.1 hypothetical protein [Aerococcaceae bacterium zg-A91]MBS4457128.1 hypothetical protein [Aerococcaceae bacterium zg-BR33]